MKHFWNTCLIVGAVLTVSLAAGCKNESGEDAANCSGKQSVVTEKLGKNEDGHLMMYVSCNPKDELATWYVIWDDPEKDQAEYDRYQVGDNYP